ncbi:hypothetical protein HMPREF1008_01850 [Olsenella sp. oral taxon 809 str. F0356]|uniref:type II toxin-antitoxin system HicB family antitoxin n=1 Tax=Olsenella sp. oral taxon 809 TaxID=661086 RepID=UPI000231F399|nr:type II toxin-antitoxin system HicB family antitoxin [Olsenella sp. oral taxon 809]EHF01370.1 hypothetical protein HMPREF1008_01850 [Olsenella sp. oral taxon 809 str. F0356]
MRDYVFMTVLEKDEEGGYDVSVPDLPGCFSHGDTRMRALASAADAMATYIASLLVRGEPVPEPRQVSPDDGREAVAVYFQTDGSYVLPGERVSAAEAARRLGVSAGRVTQMIASGILDGFRIGRHTFVTVASIERRLAEGSRPGRPSGRQRAALA